MRADALKAGLTLALALLLALPASASAGTASLKLVPGPCDIVCSKYNGQPPPQAQLRYDAAPGEANAVTLSLAGKTVTVRDDGAPVTPADNCTRVDDHVVTCATTSAPFSYTVALGDGSDTLTVAGAIGSLLSATGEAGDDQLTGGGEIDLFDGGPGRDRIATAGGDDRVTDGDADPDAIDGGGDRDALDLSSRSAPAEVDLAAGTGADGGALTGVEDVVGGSGNDALTGDGAPNSLTGGKGDDLLKGGGGDDYIEGGPGRDLIAAGTGNDDIATRDGTSDSIACGDGRDKVRDLADGSADEYGETQPYVVGPDLSDVLDLDCELTVFGARLDVDGTLVAAPPVRFTKHVLVLRTPCRCAGTVTARNALFALGKARFTKRARTVLVRSPRRRFEGVVELRWRSGRRTGAWSVTLPGPR